MLQGNGAAATQAGYGVMVGFSDGSEASDATQIMLFREKGVDAIVSMGGGFPKVLYETQKIIPVVTVSGGGSMLDTSSHSVDLFRYMIGEIESQTALYSKHFEKSDGEDTAILLVKSVDGVIGSLSSCFVAGAGKAFIEVTGLGGVLTYDYFKPEEIMYKKRG